MNRHEFALVEALMDINEDMRVIAVGDDDQNIYEFRDSDSRYLKTLITKYDAVQYELLDNYRSSRNIVELANSISGTMESRMKKNSIIAVSNEQGVAKITKYATNNEC